MPPRSPGGGWGQEWGRGDLKRKNCQRQREARGESPSYESIVLLGRGQHVSPYSSQTFFETLRS